MPSLDDVDLSKFDTALAVTPETPPTFLCHCPGRPGRLSALSVFHSKSVLYGAFVWARRALNRQKRRFSARAATADAGVTAAAHSDPLFVALHRQGVEKEYVRCDFGGHGCGLVEGWGRPAMAWLAERQYGVAVGLYPIVTFQYCSTTLYQVSYHIR